MRVRTEIARAGAALGRLVCLFDMFLCYEGVNQCYPFRRGFRLAVMDITSRPFVDTHHHYLSSISMVIISFIPSAMYTVKL